MNRLYIVVGTYWKVSSYKLNSLNLFPYCVAT